MYKDVNDLYIKPIDAMDRGKWSKMIRGNWSDSHSDSDSDSESDAESKSYISGASSPRVIWISSH